MRYRTAVILVLLLCGGLVVWQHGREWRVSTAVSADERVWERLEQPIALPLDKVRLAEALRRLGKQMEVPLEVPDKPGDPLDPEFDVTTWESLQQSVSFPSVTLPAYQILQLLQFQSELLGATVHDGRVQSMSTHSGFLIGAQLHTIPAALQKATGWNSKQFGSCIEIAVCPETWSTNGGSGSMQVKPGALMVMQEPEVHRQIKDLIEALADAERYPERTIPRPIGTSGQWPSAAVRAKLNQPLHLPAKLSLNEFVKLLNEFGIPTLIDRRHLEDRGIGADEKVACAFENLPARLAIERFLRGTSLASYTRYRILVITLPEQCDSALETFVYPVADLQPLSRAHSNELIDVIGYLAESNHQLDSVGSMTQCGHSLIITHTRKTHNAITDLLTQLRATLKNGGSDATEDDPFVPTEAERRLEQRISLHLHERPLLEVVREQLTATGLKLVVDELAAEEVGLDVTDGDEAHDANGDIQEPEDPFERPVEPDKTSDNDAAIDDPVVLEAEPLLVTVDVDREPLWSAFKRMLTPHELSIVPLHGSTVELTMLERAQTDHRTTRVYHCAALLGPAVSEDRQLEWTSLVENTVAPGSWVSRGGHAFCQSLDDLLVVSQTESAHRMIRDLLDDLMLVPDAPDGITLVGQSQNAFEAYCDFKDNFGAGEPYVVRVYALPRASQHIGHLVRRIITQVSPNTWDEVADHDGTIVPFEVEGRWCLVVHQTPSVHRELRLFLGAPLDSQALVPSESHRDGDWQRLSIAADERNPSATLLMSSCTRELELLRNLLPHENVNAPLDSLTQRFDLAIEFQEYLMHRMSLAEPSVSRPIYMGDSHLALLADDDSKDRAVQNAIGEVMQSLSSLVRGLEVEPDGDKSPAIDRLVTMLFDDPQLTRRQEAAFLLRILVRGNQPLSDRSMVQLVTHETQAQDPLLRETLSQMAWSVRYSSDNILPVILDAIPTMNDRLRLQVIEQLGYRGPAIVPHLCHLFDQELDGESTAVVVQSLFRAARNDEQSIRHVLESAVDWEPKLQREAASNMVAIDRSTKRLRAVLRELSQRHDSNFQAKWGPLHEMLIEYLGDE